MKTNIPFLIFLGITLLLSACGSPAAPTAAPLVSSPAHLAVGQNASLGSFLTDSNGMTLYLFTTDSPGTSTCYGSCAVLWPPLLTSGAPVAGIGVNNAMIGTITRTDGTTQVTYNNWPLYYYQKDVKPGDTTGENVQGVWFVITPAGLQK